MLSFFFFVPYGGRLMLSPFGVGIKSTTEISDAWLESADDGVDDGVPLSPFPLASECRL